MPRMSRIGLRIAALIAMAGSCVPSIGCWAPTRAAYTSVTVNPWTHSLEFYDGKDNLVDVKGLSYNPTTKEFRLDELHIDNRASSVIAMQAEMMRVWNEQMQTANEGLRMFTDLAAALVPIATQYMTTRQAIATDDPNAAKVLDAIQRLITASQVPPAETAPPTQPPPAFPPSDRIGELVR